LYLKIVFSRYFFNISILSKLLFNCVLSKKQIYQTIGILNCRQMHIYIYIYKTLAGPHEKYHHCIAWCPSNSFDEFKRIISSRQWHWPYIFIDGMRGFGVYGKKFWPMPPRDQYLMAKSNPLPLGECSINYID
jgi:hypothetical protein